MKSNGHTPDRRIHVMQATLGMNFGGMERVIMDLYRHMNPEKFRFSVCCLSLRGPLADEVEADGVPLIVCENQSKAAKYLRAIEFSRILKEQQVDVLHTHNTTAFIDGVLGAKIAGVPVIVHTDHCKNYPIEKRWMVAENVASRFVDKVVAVSHHTRGELMEFEGIKADKLAVIHNGLNPRPPKKSGDAIRQQLGLRPEEIVIGTIGRLHPQKGLELLLDATPALTARHANVRVVIVGGGDLEEPLKAHAAALGLGDRVVFAGWRKDPIDVMQSFDVFVQTSNYEGLPMVLLEAMAMAKPVVASAVGGVPEIIGHDENGLLVHGRDPEALTAALSRVVSDEGMRRRLGDTGRARYEQGFTAEAMAAAYERLYDEFLDKRKARVS